MATLQSPGVSLTPEPSRWHPVLTCSHERVIQINGKTSDMRSVSVPHLDLEDYTGSVRIGDIARGDYMTVRLCLGCGLALNFQTMSDDEVKEAFEDV